MPKKRRKVNSSRYKDAYENRDSGAPKKGVLDWSKHKGNRPPFWKSKKGKFKFNIIPFEVKSKNHPLIKQKKLEVGDLDFALDIWIHRNVGPDKVQVLCPKKTYGKHCPVCDLVSEYYDNDKKKEASALKASHRSFLNLQPIIDDEPQKIHIFETSHFRFTKELMEEANEMGDGGDIVPFSDLEDGSEISCRVSDDSDFKNDWIYKSFRFHKRDEELDDDIVDGTVSFDALITVPSPDDLEKAMYGQDEDDEEEDEPRKKSKSRDDDEEDDEPKSKKKKDREEEDEDEEPPRKKKRSRDDDEDDEEEDEPKKKSRKSKDDDDEESECPHGHNFGECEKHPECTRCEKWDDCDDYSVQLKKKKRK